MIKMFLNLLMNLKNQKIKMENKNIKISKKFKLIILILFN